VLPIYTQTLEQKLSKRQLAHRCRHNRPAALGVERTSRVDHSGRIARRLARDFPARMIKDRVHAHALAGGALEGEASQQREGVSGHSLRAGFITSAALGGTPDWKIRGHSRHKSADMVAKYVRAAAQWNDSTIKGIRF